MAERYQQLKDMVNKSDLFHSITVSDYLFSKCLLFAKINLPEEEFRLFQKLFEIMHQQLIYPDMLIYLHSSVDKLQKNIKKRNREYEQKIPDAYLYNIQETYTAYIKQHNISTIFIDATNADFLGNDKHLQLVLDALESDSKPGQYYITL
jgi:deoxyadenosine/deoxycytidine kinase